MSGAWQPWVLAAVPACGRYLVFDMRVGIDPAPALRRLADAVPVDRAAIGFGDPLVRALHAAVPGLRPFPAVSGKGLAFPSTQGALWAFVPGETATEVHDCSLALRAVLGDGFELREEVSAFRYREGRDLTGYVDGTANPVDDAAVEAAIVNGKGLGLDGSSFVAAQRYVHDLDAFHRLASSARDDVFGRRLADNEEMADAPRTAHAKRAEQESFEPSGFMVRRSMPWGSVREHGLYFVAYGESLDRFERTLLRMAGVEDGLVDSLLFYTRAVTGGYYWCPPVKGGGIDLSAVMPG
jgi:putative iron-dependent peroxidase